MADLLIGILVVLVGVLVAWFLISRELERRRLAGLSQAVARVVQPLGSKGRVRLLGHGACEMHLSDVRPPFRDLRVVVWLAPRDLLPVWLIRRLGGQRDVVGIAAELSRPPTIVFELISPRTTVGRRALGRLKRLEWSRMRHQLYGQDLLLVAPDLPAADAFLHRLEASGAPPEVEIYRLAVEDRPPHLSVSVGPPERVVEMGPRLVAWLIRLAELVESRRPS